MTKRISSFVSKLCLFLSISMCLLASCHAQTLPQMDMTCLGDVLLTHVGSYGGFVNGGMGVGEISGQIGSAQPIPSDVLAYATGGAADLQLYTACIDAMRQDFDTILLNRNVLSDGGFTGTFTPETFTSFLTNNQNPSYPGFYKIPPNAFMEEVTLNGSPTDKYYFLIPDDSVFRSKVALAGGITEDNVYWLLTERVDSATPITLNDRVRGQIYVHGVSTNFDGAALYGRAFFDGSSYEATITFRYSINVEKYYVAYQPPATDCSVYNTLATCGEHTDICIWNEVSSQCQLKTSVPCLVAHGSDATACLADDMCHMEDIGPYSVCTDGLAVGFDHLYYNLPFEIRSVTVTGPTLVDVVFRVPIFQPYSTIGWFSFLMGALSNFVPPQLYTIEASNVCNTLLASGEVGVLPILVNEFPLRYDQLVAKYGLSDDATMLSEMTLLQTWINTHNVAPWIVVGGSTSYSGNVAFWKDVFGAMHTPDAPTAPSSSLMTRGLLSKWSMPSLNYIDWTLHLNMDLIYQTCRATAERPPPLGAIGFDYMSSDVNGVTYVEPITLMQRTSHNQTMGSTVYLSLHESTTQTVQVTTTVVQTTNFGNIGVKIVSLEMVNSGALNEYSLTSSHALRMVFDMTIPQPLDADVISYGPKDDADVTFTASGQPTNCYGDFFTTTPSSTLLSCTTGSPRVCTYRVSIESASRVDLVDGTSFSTCAGTLGAASNILDRLHIFYMYPQMCTQSNGQCIRVSSTPMRIVSSFNYPIFPVQTMTQDLDVFALVLPSPTTDIAAFVASDMTYTPEVTYISSDSLLTVAVVTRREAWTRYVLRILDGPSDMLLDSAPLGTAIDDPTAWTSSFTQTQLTDGMVHVTKTQAIALGETRTTADVCQTAIVNLGDAGAGKGCDSFVMRGSWLFTNNVGPQIRWTLTVNVDKSTFIPQSRRLLGFDDVDATAHAKSNRNAKTYGYMSHSSTKQRVHIAPAQVQRAPLVSESSYAQTKQASIAAVKRKPRDSLISGQPNIHTNKARAGLLMSESTVPSAPVAPLAPVAPIVPAPPAKKSAVRSLLSVTSSSDATAQNSMSTLANTNYNIMDGHLSLMMVLQPADGTNGTFQTIAINCPPNDMDKLESDIGAFKDNMTVIGAIGFPVIIVMQLIAIMYFWNKTKPTYAGTKSEHENLIGDDKNQSPTVVSQPVPAVKVTGNHAGNGRQSLIPKKK